MLKTKSVAKLIQDTLNKQSTEEQFRFVYEYGSYKGTEINAIIKQGKGTITPIMNYTTSTNPFFIEFVVPTRCGEDRIDGIVEIINGMIDELNGKIKPVGNGRCMFAFNPLEIGGLETRATAGQSVLIKLEFNIEYSETSGKADEVVYEMALINSPFFEADEINTRYFEDEHTQQDWYLNKIKDGGIDFTKTFTPINESSTTQQIIYINENGLNNDDIITKNCAIIRQIKNGVSDKYFYYRVESASVNIFNQVMFDLKMDTLQTYYFKDGFNIPECLIERGQLNRFIQDKDNDENVLFDSSDNSMLFEDEGAVLPKRVVNRKKIRFNYTGIEKVDKWLNDNVLYWAYVFVGNKDTEYNVINLEDKSTQVKFNAKNTTLRYRINDGAYEFTDLGCFCYPVLKSDKSRMYIEYTTKTGDVDVVNHIYLGSYGGIDLFRKINNDSSYIYSIKYSNMPPFQTLSDYRVGSDLVLISNRDTANKETQLYLGDVRDYSALIGVMTGYSGDLSYGLITRITQKTNSIVSENLETELSIPKVFIKEEIKKNSEDIIYNPKLYSQNIKELLLCGSEGSSFAYDYQKLGQNNLNVLYSEPIQSEITKYYLRLNPVGLYDDATKENYTGLVGSNDNSVLFTGTSYSEFLANNKNFFQQSEADISYDTFKTIGDVNKNNAFFSVAGASSLKEGIQGTFKQYRSNQKIRQDRDFSIDNIKQSPNSIKNAGGNAVFNIFINTMGFYMEEHDSLEQEKQKINDMNIVTGFKFGKIGNIKDFDHIRKFYNYIEADIDSINYEISNSIKEDIKQRFATGVRFWDLDNIDFTVSNYERWLDN